MLQFGCTYVVSGRLGMLQREYGPKAFTLSSSPTSLPSSKLLSSTLVHNIFPSNKNVTTDGSLNRDRKLLAPRVWVTPQTG